MKAILLSAVLILVTSTHLQATESIVFDGGGYYIDILVGSADKPSVVQVRFSAPEAKDWVIIPRELLRIEKFDDAKRILIMRFTNKSEADLPASFSLVVRGKSAVLSIGGKRIPGSFDWMD